MGHHGGSPAKLCFDYREKTVQTHQEHNANSIRPVVVIPTYDNGGTLERVLDRIEAVGVDMIVVNDGSSDDTSEILERWSSRSAGINRIHRTHDVNRGKAAAMLTGFKAASEAGYTHGVTIDSDDQLDPEQIPVLIEVATTQPSALVLGMRNDMADDYPARSRMGRRTGDLAARVETGVRMIDTPCGFRVYPIRLIESVPCHSGRFAWEGEILTRAAWAGFPVVNEPVRCRYFPKGERVSHFKLGRDWGEGLLLHVRLLLRTIAPVPTRFDRPGPLPRRSLLRSAWDAICPLRLFRLALGDHADTLLLASSVGLGVLVGIIPAWPWTLLPIAWIGWRLHAHLVAAMIGFLPAAWVGCMFKEVLQEHLPLMVIPWYVLVVPVGLVSAIVVSLVFQWILLRVRSLADGSVGHA